MPERPLSPEPPEETLCPEGHVRLHLYQKPFDDTAGADPSNMHRHVYLEIPTERIEALCHYPLKYLQYLGWSILGVDGYLSATLQSGIHLPVQGVLENRMTYYYVTGEQGLAIDVCRVVDLEYHVRAATRGMAGEVDMDLDSVDDIRNGLVGAMALHKMLDSRNIVIMKTPNRVLGVDDIPHAPGKRQYETLGTSFPNDIRFTAQWLHIPPSLDPLQAEGAVANNCDAMFKTNTPESELPSGIILDYIYGATALKWWGKNTALLADFVTPRPAAGALTPMGPPQEHKTRNTARTKRKKDLGAGGYQRDAQNTGNSEILDPLDVVFLFQSKTRAAIERRRQEDQEERRFKAQISGWAEDVAREGYSSP
ncbi:hypothetical protein HWV62_35648 [Athelia sp. TMB]|nr:hypothetical protein HWV62_35648 [Athelia sp. TMB]